MLNKLFVDEVMSHKSAIFSHSSNTLDKMHYETRYFVIAKKYMPSGRQPFYINLIGSLYFSFSYMLTIHSDPYFRIITIGLGYSFVGLAVDSTFSHTIIDIPVGFLLLDVL